MESKPATAQVPTSPARSLPSRPARIFSARWARLAGSWQKMQKADKLFSNLSRLDYTFELESGKYSAKLGKQQLGVLQGKDKLISEINMLYGAVTPEKAESMAAAYKRAAKLVRIAVSAILISAGAGNLLVAVFNPGLTPLVIGVACLIGCGIFNLKFPKFNVPKRAEWILGLLGKAKEQSVPS